MPRRSPRHLVLLLFLCVSVLTSKVAVASSDIDPDVAYEMSNTVVTALEAGAVQQGLTAARKLREYLKGEGSGGDLAGLHLLRRIERVAEVYALTAEDPDASVLEETKLALQVFRSAVPGQPVRYPNGNQAAYRFDAGHTWYFSNGKQIAYRPTEGQTWYFSNGKQVAYRPTNGQTWYYPNGKQVAYRPTSGQTWYYANGKQICYRPTNQQTWYYPNGRQICYRFGQAQQAWYYPDGTLWKAHGPGYSNEELADAMKVILQVLEDASWSARAGAPSSPVSMASLAARQGSGLESLPETARTLRRLEREMLDKLRFERQRQLGERLGTVGEFLDAASETATEIFCYEEIEGFRAEVRKADVTLRFTLDERQEAIEWEGLEVLPRPAP